MYSPVYSVQYSSCNETFSSFKGIGVNLFFEDETYPYESKGSDPSINVCICFVLPASSLISIK